MKGLRITAKLLASFLIGVSVGAAASAHAQQALAGCIPASDVTYVLNHESVPSEGAPDALICDGHTLVPLRWLSEALGNVVRWDGAERTITITANGRETEGVSAYVDRVRTGPEGTTVTVRLNNLTEQRRFVRELTVTFLDGYGRTMTSVTESGGGEPIALEAKSEQLVTVEHGENLAGYVSIRIDMNVGRCPVACPPLPSP